ncbi:hypothetical protein HPP92_024930 [Vanilla planifolia]|uniref:Uncharacterized protein n=1 Tax=Vanilla planifolia TaxID=51239 RepID=A0A835PMX1_VANPL|nr:hypothetical protein HPP92_024930 [Vanilla planifolia]
MLSERNTAIHDSASSICQNINDANVLFSPDTLSKEAHVQKSAQKATKGTELQEVKNASEKKSRKQKNSQIRAVTDQVKESSKASHERSRAKLDTKEAIDNKKEQEKPVVVVKTTQGITVEAGPKNPAPEDLESSNFVGAQVSTSGVCLGKKLEVEERKFQGGGVNVVSVANVVLSPNNLAWKPAQGQRAKSLLEIQQEEQQKVQIQSSSKNIPEIMPMNDSVPPVASNTGNSVQKYVGDTLQDVSSTTSVALNPENLLDSINMIGNSHNILLEDFSAKSSGARDITGNHENGSLLSSPQNVSAQTGLVVADDDDDFVEAKDTRRIRRSRKNKGVVVKASKSLTADDSSNLPSISGKTKPTKVGLDEEFFPVPAVPSLGDFVFWKGDQSNSVPAPAWSADPIKLQKPTSLRDILREQQNKTNSNQPQIQTSTMKAQPSSGKGISSLQASGPSKGLPSNNSKSAAPIQSVSPAPGLSKMRTEDDFFWGPLDQAKNGARSDFPRVANSSSSTLKGNSTKMVHGDSLNRKPSSGRASEHSSSFSSSQSVSKGNKNKNATSKHSEAMDFRDWCEREWFRLTGTNDTSFIEFCLKQRSSEAEALLKENLSSLDCNHEFIDKFINYMEFLSPQVLESAFLGQTVGSSHTERVVSRDVEIEADNGVDGSSRETFEQLSNYDKQNRTLDATSVRKRSERPSASSKHIASIFYDDKKNTVTISGQFDPQKLKKKILCKACKVIKEIKVKEEEKKPPPLTKDTKPPESDKTKLAPLPKEKETEKPKEKEDGNEKPKEKEKHATFPEAAKEKPTEKEKLKDVKPAEREKEKPKPTTQPELAVEDQPMLASGP